MDVISIEELSQLKEQALTAILNNQALPGSDKALQFPDLPFILSEQQELYLLDEYIKTTVYLRNKSVKVVSPEHLQGIADKMRKVIYFQIQTSSSGSEDVSMSVEAKILTASPHSRIQDLTNMQLKFQKVQNEWRIVDEPSYLSA